MVKMTSVWDRTVDFLRDDAARLLPVAGALIFLPNLVNGLIDGATDAPAGVSATSGIAALALALLTLWGGTAITALAIHPSPPGYAVSHAGRRLLPVIGISLLLLLMMFLLALPFAAILAAGGVGMAALMAAEPVMPDVSGTTAMLLLLYGLVVVVIGLWVTARLMILIPVIVAERRGLGAITRAWVLTRGHGGRLIGVLLLYALVAGVISMAVGAVTGLFGLLLSGGSGLNAGAIVVAVAMALVAAVLSVVQSAFVGKLYVALTPTTGLEETFA